MAVRTQAVLKSNAGAVFADNTTGEITEQDLREYVIDQADSFILPEDSVTRLSDVSNAGSGAIITNDERTKLTALPTSGNSFPLEPGDGDQHFHILDSILYERDDELSKWVSVFEVPFHFGASGLIDGRYLNVAGGTVVGNFGYTMLRNGIITGVSARAENNPTKAFQIDIGTRTNAGNFSLANNIANEKALNVSFDADDDIRVWVSNVGSAVQNPIVTLLIRWTD